MPYQIKNIPMLQRQGDPLLGALGAVAGTAIGTAVGGPIGGSIGGSIGGQLGGTGTVDLEKTAVDSAQSAAMGTATNAAASGLGSVMGTQTGALAAANDLGISPLSEQAQMLGAQGGVEFAPNAFDEDPSAGFFKTMKERYFNQGGQIPEPQMGWSSMIPGGQGMQTGVVDDLAMGMAYSPTLMKLTSPVGSALSEMYVGSKMDGLGQANQTMRSNDLTIADKAGNVRPVNQGQMSAYKALASNDPFSGGFGNQKEAISTMKHGFGSDQHFNQIDAQMKEIKTGSNNTSGDNNTNMVRGSSGSPILNARTGAPIANANQPSVDSTGSGGSPAGGK